MAGSSDRADRPSNVVLGALAAAVLTSAVELLIQAARRWRSDFVWSGGEIVWMTPLGYAFLFVVPAIVLAPLAGRLARLPLSSLVAGGCIGLGSASVLRLLSSQRVHLAAIALLGLGVGVQVGRILHRRTALERRRMLFSAVLASSVALLVAVGALLAWDVRRAPDRPVSRGQADAGAPNVLLLILDTVRSASLSLYGHSRPTTPRLEEWARRGVVFDQAIAASSWTLPSHASMFTGRFAYELSADWMAPLDNTAPTLAEALTARGYRTGGFVANQVYNGTETGLARGFGHYRVRPFTLKQLIVSTELGQWLRALRFLQLDGRTMVLRSYPRKSAEVVNREFLDWVGRDEGTPFFAFLNFFDAHVPFHAPDSVRALLPGVPARLEGQYEVSIRYLDGQIHALLGELERRGLLRNTLVIVTSDHGEDFGEHGLQRHGTGLYLTQVQVPLVLIKEGSIPGGIRVGSAVTLRNLAATILDLTGGQGPIALPGASWARFWRHPDSSKAADPLVAANLTPRPRPFSWYRNARGELRSILHDEYQYINNADRSEEIYRIGEDRMEERNLIENGAAVPSLAAIRALMQGIDSQYPRKPAPDSAR